MSLGVEAATPRLRLPCVAHIGSTTQGHTFGAIGHVVSGIIACSLAQQAAQAPEKLRRAIAKVLFASSQVADGPFPRDDEPHRDHLAAVLDACLSKDKQGQERRLTIWLGMTGDTNDDMVTWHPPGGRDGIDDNVHWEWVLRQYK